MTGLRSIPVGVPRGVAVGTGLLLGVGVGVLAASERWWPIIAIIPLSALLALAVRGLIAPEDRASVGAIIGLSFALHVAAAVLLYTGSLAAGRGGFIPGDDSAYADVAENFARYLKGDYVQPGAGPPYWRGNEYLFGTWVYLESAIFLLIGPEVLVPILLNGAFALVTALLVYDIARRLFDRRSAYIALALTAFFPSLVLWSSLNLKDALALLLIGICLWAIVRFHQSPRWWSLALALAVLIPMESVRVYTFAGLAILIPVAVALTPGLRRAARLRWTLSALGLGLVLLATTQAQTLIGPQIMETLEGQRYALGVGARTRYGDVPPVVVKEGDTFVVGGSPSPTSAATVVGGSPSPTSAATVVGGSPSPSSAATVVGGSPSPTSPASTPRVVHVAPNSRIVVATGSPAAASPGVVHVRPGDIVVVGSAERSPRPADQRTVLPIPPREDEVTLASQGLPPSEVAIRSIRYLPVGAAFALFGPFPWLFDRGLDYLILPETLVWYVCLAAAARTVFRHRSRWQLLAPIALFAVGLLGLLAIVEGNWGTLLRHRGMVIPWVIVLAAPSIGTIASGLHGRFLARWDPPSPRGGPPIS